jgi:hypothetical protein
MGPVLRLGLICWFASTISGAPLVIPVICNGNPVGSISVDVSPGGTGITGSFTSTVGGPPPTLGAAAAACGEHHFNWFQVVTADNMPPNDANGNPLMPPYIDPPPGGYSFQWADNVPWYWDEHAPPPGTPNFDPALLLSAQSAGAVLNFADFPGGTPGTNLSFRTWLVSLNADSSLHSFHGGFSWNWSNATGSNVATPPQLINGGPGANDYDNLLRGFNSSVPEPYTVSLFSLGLLLLYSRRAKLKG